MASKSSKAPVLLSGGNPQIAKGDGDAPVQAYIDAIPGWRSDTARQLDALITRTLPDVIKAVKWNSPFYRTEGQGWSISFHTFTKYLKVGFFDGTLLKPMPPEGSKDAGMRYLHIYEGDKLDEKQLAAWCKQAAKLPGWEAGIPKQKEPPKVKATKTVEKKVTAKKTAAPTASQATGDWREAMLDHVRTLITSADPDVVETSKWVKASNPNGIPVWEHDGIICTGETYKNYVKLTFAKGAALPDPADLFNASLDGGTRRAIDIHEGEKLNEKAFKALIKAAVKLNTAGNSTKKPKRPANQG